MASRPSKASYYGVHAFINGTTSEKSEIYKWKQKIDRVGGIP
jgi:hypothetical protein